MCTGKPNRLFRAQCRPTQNYAGSYNTDGIRSILGALPQGAVETGLSVGRALPGRCGVFHVQKQADGVREDDGDTRVLEKVFFVSLTGLKAKAL